MKSWLRVASALSFGMAACGDAGGSTDHTPLDPDASQHDAGPVDGGEPRVDAEPPPYWEFDGGVSDGEVEAAAPRAPFIDLPTCDAGCAPTALSAGSANTCAVGVDGRVACWGAIGLRGRITPVSRESAPAVHISTAGIGICYVSVLGEVWCSGLGKLARMSTSGDYRSLDASDSRICAVLVDGRLTCEALDGYGLPVRVLDGTPLAGSEDLAFASVSVASDHACALDRAGALYCWGEERAGALAGRGDLTTPMLIAAGPFAEVAVGDDATCVRGAQGDVSCWGDRYTGAGATGARVITLAGPAQAIDLGRAHACALLADGSVWCWGDGYDGQLGQGALTCSAAPVRAQLSSGPAKALTTGAFHTCVIDDGDKVRCWGSDATSAVASEYGGRASMLGSPRGFDSTLHYAEVALGTDYGCAIDDAGALACWGSADLFANELSPLSAAQEAPTAVAPVGDYQAVVTSSQIGCALRDQGALWCWGRSGQGYFAPGWRSTEAQAVQPTSRFAQVAINNGNGCGITTAHGLTCWGANGGYRTDTSGQPLFETQNLLPASRFDHVALATDRGVAIDAAGRLYAFVLASIPATPPNQLTLTTVFRELSAGDGHFCAIDASAQLWCWGSGPVGTLGLGATISVEVPTRVGTASGYHGLTSRGTTTCALDLHDEVVCWGPDTVLGARTTPSAMLPGRAVKRVAAGPQRSLCVIDRDDQLLCMGDTTSLYARRFGSEVLTPSTIDPF